MDNKEKVTGKVIGVEEGWIRFACEIAKIRAKRYCDAYQKYLTLKEISPLSAESAMREARSCERRLKKPPTDLDNSEIRSLQIMVEKGKYDPSDYLPSYH